MTCLSLKISDTRLSTALLNSSSVEFIIFSLIFSSVYLLSSGFKKINSFDWFWLFSVKWKKMMWLMIQCIYDYSVVKFYCKDCIWINLHVHVFEHNQCRDFLHNIPVFTKVIASLDLKMTLALFFFFFFFEESVYWEIKVHTWVNRIISNLIMKHTNEYYKWN